MNFLKLALRNVHFHWRTQLGVLLGLMIASAVLAGALAVGDSVRYTLRQMALRRVGRVHFALPPSGRFFRAALADDLQQALGVTVAPVIQLQGTVSRPDGSARATNVQLLGVDDRFHLLSPRGATPSEKRSALYLNERLRSQLGAVVGEEVLIRLERPSPLPRDSSMAVTTDRSVALRITIGGTLDDDSFGRFSLQNSQVPPYNAVLPLPILQRELGLKGRANTLLVGDGKQKSLSSEQLESALRSVWRLEDVGLRMRILPSGQGVELRSQRIFFEPPLALVALQAFPGARGVLTYFVNELRLGDRSTPYSLVAAMGEPLVPRGMKDDEIILNRWLADDLRARVGDRLQVRYYVDSLTRRLEERVSEFRVREIVPMEGAALDVNLMPDFPGIAEAANCRDWNPGIPIDLSKIRPKDEAYWHRYRGTPKAFISLSAGQRLWQNRFGNLTAVRYPPLSAHQREALCARLLSSLSPSQLGMSFRAVRAEALRASGQALDFGQLFLGLSIVLIISALLLANLLFVFSVESRQREFGILLALGFRQADIRRLLLRESGLLICLGCILGSCLGLVYTRAVIYSLNTIWKAALGMTTLSFHFIPSTLFAGCLLSMAAALLSLVITLNQQTRQTPVQLLSRTPLIFPRSQEVTERKPLLLAALSAGGGLILLLLALTNRSINATGVFFAAGFMLLLSFLSFCQALLAQCGREESRAAMTITSLCWRNASRRRGRSLTTIALLSLASFLIVSVGANRHDERSDLHERRSGTGGFTLIAQSTLPIYEDINSQQGRDSLGIDSSIMQGVHIIPARIHEGDEASCLNLNRAQIPRLVGVNPALLSRRGAFTFVNSIQKTKHRSPWHLLEEKHDSQIVPAIGDQATVVWGLHKNVGDRLSLMDERGALLQLQIVGILANSILQGSLLVSEERLLEHFPSESGYRLFLIDSPRRAAKRVAEELSRSLEDFGIEVVPAERRLAEFSAVENSYIAIFQMLGGLGLLLGSAGMGIVLMRNVLDRRAELALLQAVGAPLALIRRVVLWEHLGLLLFGIGGGTAAAFLALSPRLQASANVIPLASLGLTMLAVMMNGYLWTWLATVISLRQPFIEALRNE